MVDLRFIGVDRAAFVVHVTVRRQALRLLPALNGANARLQIDGDFLPGPKPVRDGYYLGWAAVRHDNRHYYATGADSAAIGGSGHRRLRLLSCRGAFR